MDTLKPTPKPTLQEELIRVIELEDLLGIHGLQAIIIERFRT